MVVFKTQKSLKGNKAQAMWHVKLVLPGNIAEDDSDIVTSWEFQRQVTDICSVFLVVCIRQDLKTLSI